MKKLAKNIARKFARDDGVAGIVLAMVISIVAFSALAVFLAKHAGPTRELAKLTAGNRAGPIARSALLAHFLQQSPTSLPCPDTDQDGDTDCTDTTGTASGTLPWRTLGISRDDAIDAYGRYYTYVVLADAEAREVCTNVENDYDTDEVEYTGALKDQTSLEVRSSTQGAGEGAYVPFVVISHGPNGLGGISASGTNMSAPVADSAEEDNADDAGPAVVVSGPYNSTAGSAFFDDIVMAPTAAQMQKICEDMSPGEEMNAALTEDFAGTGPSFDSTKFTTAGSGTVPTQTGGQAQFTASTSFLATAAGYDFAPTVRPVYVSALWTPDSAATNAGFSIATRATLPPTGDIFTTGLTFRFDDRDGSTSSVGGVANNVSIRTDAGVVTTTGDSAYSIIAGEQYLLEVFDSGSDVWMRVTQIDDVTNTATIQGSDSTDRTGDQKVAFINGAGTSRLDDVSIGLPMLSLATGPTAGYAATATPANGTTTGSLTLEAWIRPRSLPATGVETTIISQWDTAEEDDSSYRLYLSGSVLTLDLNDTAGTGDAETFSLGFGPTVNEWMHIAVSYDATSRAVRSYKNGVFVSSATSTLDAGGINSAEQSFAVGADSVNTPPAHFFHGNISDVRAWNDARLATEVARCYQKRLPAATPCLADASLIVNWKLDPTIAQGGLAETDAVATAGTAGTLTGSSYAPALSTYFRAISSDFCPGPGDLGTGSQGTRSGAYQCDFRAATGTTTGTTWDIDIPTNLLAVYAKVWGAGGGGYSPGSRDGGDAGFSSGLIGQINSVDIAGMNIAILAGGAGSGSTTSGTGAGGGAGSLVSDLSDHISIIAGGGGGASYSNTASVSCNGAARCGDGADGAGASSTTSTATDGTSTCGGRGGSTGTFGANPPTGGSCPDGGQDPTGSLTTGGRGGFGTSGAVGGSGTIGALNVAGGRGYRPLDTSASPNASAVGAGGGGGGYVGGEAGGYDDGSATQGYGGGGGSGFAAAGVSGVVTSTAFSDAACTADLTNNSTAVTITSCTTGTTDLVGRGWAVGMTISGNGISAGTTISSINSNTLVMSAQATNGSNPTVTVSGVSGGGSSTGTGDGDYSPAYLAAGFQNPGQGGTAGSAGNPGAVILKW